MGMIFVARRLTDDQSAGLAADPSSAAMLLADDSPPALRPHRDPVPGSGPVPDVGPVLDLDKAWHGIHFLLTGSAWETTPGAGEAVLGGDPIGGDLGYGPARLLTTDRVQTVAAALRDRDPAALRATYDPAALMEAAIYPQVWDETDAELYLVPYYAGLREFYLAAAGEKQAVLLAVT